MLPTPTKKIDLGFRIPAFNLPDTLSGKPLTHQKIVGNRGTLVMFISNNCPYVLHLIREIVDISNEYINKGIGFVAINSNDFEKYPEDHPDKMKEFGLSYRFPFPYLHDESQEVARAYNAACTPDFNLFDAKGKCVYRGQLDSSRPENDNEINGENMRKAIDFVLIGRNVPTEQIPNVGCGIKWKE